MRALEGLLLLDKPVGPTSHDIVAAVRRATGTPRVGHAGTLDPTASGLLPVLLGRATRLLRFLPQAPKRYQGKIRLGVRTTTDDAAGEVTARHEGPLPGSAEVLAAAARLRGPLLQTPPAVSAKSVGGVRAYELARRGRPFSPRPVRVEVLRFDVEPGEEPAVWAFTAEVSGGTYLRALARDLGEMLGCGAILAELRRTAIGPLDLAEAIAWTPAAPPGLDILEAAVTPLERIPLACARVRLSKSAHEERFLAGRDVEPGGEAVPAGPIAVLSQGGELLGIGEGDSGRIRPRVVLAGGGP